MVGPAAAPPHSPASPRPPWSAGTWLEGVLMAAWLVACDAWLKIMARVATCDATPTVGDAWAARWTVPAGCGEADLFGIARLSPVVRNGGPLGLGEGLLDGGAGMAWAVALLVGAALGSGLVLRWRWRTRGDALALGALWGAALILAVPRLGAGGAGVTELQLGPLSTGLGDLALGWALAWLVWRVLAETRA